MKSLAKAVMLILLLFNAGVLISSADSPPPLPNTFSGTIKFANSSGQFDVPAGTVIEALIENVTKGSTTVIEAGKYRIDVSGSYDDDGKNITFIVNNLTAEQRAVFNASSPPPRTLNLIVKLPEQAYVNITNISSCITIPSPGVYVLNTSIINSTATTCINITSSNVVFDGSGYIIDGVGSMNTNGVYVYNPTAELTNVTVKNIIITDWYSGLYYRKAAGGSITNNSASSNDIGILLESSSNNTLVNNNASWNSIYGISLGSSNNNNLTNNNASSNILHASGIFLGGSRSNTLTNNSASSNGYSGIELYLSSFNRLAGNNASSNNHGIYLHQSDNNTITNSIANLNYNGILLISSANNTITNSRANFNSRGIYLNSSSSNIIFNNYFNNTNNFYFGSINYANYWNISRQAGTNIIGGAYLGGNFWAHPNGAGFSQTCTDADGDGICDLPYVLDANNTDYLSLAYRANITTLPAPKPKVPRKPIAGKLEVILIPENPTIYDNVSMEVKLTYPTAGYKVKFGNVSIKNNTITLNVDSEEPKGMAAQVITTYSKKYNLGYLSEGAYACEVYINGVLAETYRFVVSATVAAPPSAPGGGGGY